MFPSADTGSFVARTESVGVFSTGPIAGPSRSAPKRPRLDAKNDGDDGNEREDSSDDDDDGPILTFGEFVVHGLETSVDDLPGSDFTRDDRRTLQAIHSMYEDTVSQIQYRVLLLQKMERDEKRVLSVARKAAAARASRK